MSDEELLQSILNIPAENQTIDFKRISHIKNSIDRILESIVAMTNTDGGFIILGVDDPEKKYSKDEDRIFGIEENLENYDHLGRQISKIIPALGNIWPPQLIKTPKNLNVAIISVPKSTDNFRSINNHVYIRLSKSNKLLSTHELVKFAYAKGFEKADKELVDVPFNLLNTQHYLEWKNSRNISGSSIEEILEKTGLAKRIDDQLKPTRAAVLLFAEYPSDIMETKCTVRIFQYAGKEKTYGDRPNLISTPKTIQAPLVRLIKESHEYVLSLLKAGIRVPSGFVNQYQIPERAVKEAITNAVIHRDYHIKKDIEINIYEDRVEIENPGLFPFNITPANIGIVRSDGYRNDLLVKHLREFPSPPNLDQSEGVKSMRSEMYNHQLYPPIFFTYPHLQDAVRVVLFNEKVNTEWEKVQHYLKQNKYLTNEIARTLTGVEQRDSMAKILKGWCMKGLLIQIKPLSGYVRDTKYRLPNSNELESK